MVRMLTVTNVTGIAANDGHVHLGSALRNSQQQTQ